MKQFILTLAAIVAFTSVAMANNSPGEIPLQISALLLSPQFAQTVNQLTKAATNSGQSIRLASCSYYSIGQQEIASCGIDVKASAVLNGTWSTAGEIVGYLSEGPQGEISVTSAYFKPAGSGPGGASVGNN